LWYADFLDSLLTSFLLLPVSAAAGLLVAKAVRWYHQPGGMPPRSALQREAAYETFLVRPSAARVDIRAVGGILLWMAAEAFLLLAPASYDKKVPFDQPLEHVVVDTLVNFEQEGRAYSRRERSTERVQQSPCQRVTWNVGDIRVEADLIVERCWYPVPLGTKDRSIVHALIERSLVQVTNSTFLLWVFEATDTYPIERLWLAKGTEDPIALEAYTTAWLHGKDEKQYIRWPGKSKAQLWQMVPFYERMFDDYGCKRSIESDEASLTFRLYGSDLDYVAEVVRIFNDCPNIEDAFEFLRPLSQVLLDHVDLRIAAQEGGFAASFAPDWGTTPIEESSLGGETITVGRISVPRLNLLSSAIVGSIAVLIYFVVSRMPDFDATEAVIEHYDALKAMYERGEGDGDAKANVLSDDGDADGNVDVDVEGGEVKK
jgi:hypothetical protein